MRIEMQVTSVITGNGHQAKVTLASVWDGVTHVEVTRVGGPMPSNWVLGAKVWIDFDAEPPLHTFKPSTKAVDLLTDPPQRAVSWKPDQPYVAMVPIDSVTVCVNPADGSTRFDNDHSEALDPARALGRRWADTC